MFISLVWIMISSLYSKKEKQFLNYEINTEIKELKIVMESWMVVVLAS